MQTKKKNGLLQEAISLLTNKNLLLVMIMLVLNNSATHLSKTSINVYGESLGTTVAVLGIIGALNSWGKIVCRPFSGRGVDKFNPRNWMIVCGVLRMVTFLLFAVSDSVFLFGVSRFMEGVTNALMVTALYSLTGLCVTKDQIGTAMALYGLMPGLFTALVQGISTMVYDVGVKLPFYGSVVMLAVMCVISLFLKMPARDAEEKVKLPDEPKGKTKFKLTNYIALEGLWFLPMMWANSAHLAAEDLLIVVYAAARGEAAAGALYFSVSTLVKMWAVVPVGAFADRVGAKWAIYFGFICKAAGFILLALYPSAMMFIVAGVLKGLGMPMQNVMQAQAIKIMPRSKMGIANSTHLLLTDFGVMLMSALAGIVCAATGYTGAFLTFGIVALLGVVCYALLSKKIEGMVEQASLADKAQAAEKA